MTTLENTLEEKTNDFNLVNLIGACYNIASSAGKMISSIYESGNLGVIDKGNNDKKLSGKNQSKALDPQTLADTKAQKLIIGTLNKLFPNVLVKGEEDEDIMNPSLKLPNNITLNDIPKKYHNINPKDLIIWVDPIDGTKEYTEGIKRAVTCLIGIAYNGRPIAGIINRPFSDETIYGIVGYGSYGINKLSKSSNNRNTSRRYVVTTRSHFSKELESYMSNIKYDKLMRYGGCGGKMIMILEGECDAYVFPSKGTKKWDTCAPEAILLSEGGLITLPDGKTLLKYSTDITHHNTSGFIATWCGGSCKWFDAKKGYGFISMNDGSDDVFVHQSSLHCRGYRSLAEGEKLEFEIEVQNDGRRKAVNVTGPNGDYCQGQQNSYNDGGYNDGGYNNYNSGYSGNNSGYSGGYNNNRYNNNNSNRYNNNNSNYNSGYSNNRGYSNNGYNNKRYN